MGFGFFKLTFWFSFCFFLIFFLFFLIVCLFVFRMWKKMLAHNWNLVISSLCNASCRLLPCMKVVQTKDTYDVLYFWKQTSDIAKEGSLWHRKKSKSTVKKRSLQFKLNITNTFCNTNQIKNKWEKEEKTDQSKNQN